MGKKLMPVVALLDPELRLTMRAGALRLERKGREIRSIQPHEVSELQLHGSTSISRGARGLLLREGIDVVFISGRGDYLGRLTSAQSKSGPRRIGQYRLAVSKKERLQIAKAVIQGKIINQRAHLLVRQKSLRAEKIGDTLALRHTISEMPSTKSIEELRGREGKAAQRYFSCFKTAITNPAFTFEGRNKRPPRDPANALLSFGYALLVSKVEKAIISTGLDPYIGFFHETRRGPALALDLCEELRPWVDNTVLTLLNLRRIGPEDFRTPPTAELGEKAELSERAVYVDDIAKKILIQAWERSLNQTKPHPVTGESWQIGQLIQEQAQQIARIVEEKQAEYKPLVLW